MNVLGLGFRKSATLKSFKNALTRTKFVNSLALIAVPTDKSVHPNLIRFARALGIDIITISRAEIIAQDTTTQSKIIKHFRQSGSVAEASALVGAGENSLLIVKRVLSNDGCVAAAVARSSTLLLPEKNL